MEYLSKSVEETAKIASNFAKNLKPNGNSATPSRIVWRTRKRQDHFL